MNSTLSLSIKKINQKHDILKNHFLINLELPRNLEYVYLMILKTLFSKKTKNTKIQLFRSVFTSQVSFQIDLFLYYTLINFLSVHYLAASVIGFITGTTLNYFLSILWIFPDRKLKTRKMEYSTFILTGVAGAAINTAALWFFIDIMGAHYMTSKIVVAALVFFVTFILRKAFIFSIKKVNSSEII